MRRAAVSIGSNIAEGDERGTAQDSVRFLSIAKASLAELPTHLEIAYEGGYVEEQQKLMLEAECINTGRMLGAWIKARSVTTPKK